MEPLKKKPFNEGKGATAGVYYEDQDGKPIPVTSMLGLPVTGIGTSMKRDIYIIAGSTKPHYVTPTSSWAVIINVGKMFDGSFKTYATWDFRVPLVGGATSPNAYIHFGGDGFVLLSLILYADTDVSSSLSITAKDKNGTAYSLNITSSTLTIAGKDIKVIAADGFPKSEIIEIEMHTTSSVLFKVYEMRILKGSVFDGTIDVNIPSQKDIITWDDIQGINVNSVTTATDLSKMFDSNTTTYCELTSTGVTSFKFDLKEPTKISKVHILLGANNSQTLQFTYKDGTYSDEITGAINTFQGVGASYIQEVANPYPDKEVTGFAWRSSTSPEDIYEFYAYKAKDRYITDSTGAIINPATKEIQEEERDQLSLPNEDINIQTSPSENTDYSVKIDVGRGNKVVCSLLSDQVPSSVKVYGSNDNTNFYEMDGISIDISSWNTSKYNVYEFELYTRYVKITLTTPDTAPTRVELYVKGVRP